MDHYGRCLPPEWLLLPRRELSGLNYHGEGKNTAPPILTAHIDASRISTFAYTLHYNPRHTNTAPHLGSGSPEFGLLGVRVTPESR